MFYDEDSKKVVARKHWKNWSQGLRTIPPPSNNYASSLAPTFFSAGISRWNSTKKQMLEKRIGFHSSSQSDTDKKTPNFFHMKMNFCVLNIYETNKKPSRKNGNIQSILRFFIENSCQVSCLIWRFLIWVPANAVIGSPSPYEFMVTGSL